MLETYKKSAAALVLSLAGQVAGCSPDTSSAETPGSAAPPVAIEAAAGDQLSAPESSRGAATLRMVVAPTGNEVRYRIREQLARVELPNDAIGKTTEVTGGIAIGDNGQIIAAESKFVVNVASLASDRDRRDGYVRSRTLQTDQHPTVEFSPLRLQGLPRVLPTSGSHTFDMTGNLTVRGVTRPATWKVTARPANGEVSGSAWTAFTFADFNIDQPRVSIVLSVADTIRLEYDFRLVPKK